MYVSVLTLVVGSVYAAVLAIGFHLRVLYHPGVSKDEVWLVDFTEMQQVQEALLRRLALGR